MPRTRIPAGFRPKISELVWNKLFALAICSVFVTELRFPNWYEESVGQSVPLADRRTWANGGVDPLETLFRNQSPVRQPFFFQHLLSSKSHPCLFGDD